MPAVFDRGRRIGFTTGPIRPRVALDDRAASGGSVAGPAAVGFVGLGDMGGPMAANALTSGVSVHVFDVRELDARTPEGAEAAGSVGELAGRVDTIFMSVPDGAATAAIAREIVAAPVRRARVLVDLSTVGLAAAQAAAAIVEPAGMIYIDAPVSGGRTGAIRATITVMWSGDAAALEEHRAVLGAFAGNVFHVGTAAGQGQAMKLLNNYLSAVAMAATSEAIAFGQAQGLDMAVMLDVLNVSTGQNTATSDKFRNRVLTGTYDAGFRMALMEKDVALFFAEVEKAGTPQPVAEHVAKLWRAAREWDAGTDFTRIYEFVRRRI